MATSKAIRRIQAPLYHAKPLPERPISIPKGRPRGAKRHGLTYERDFARQLGETAQHGQWWEYRDSAGSGVCQTDVILELPDRVLIFECKYTWVPEAAIKLEALYRPVVAKALGKPTLGIVVCKKLIPRMDCAVAADLLSAVALARPGRPSVLHWMGTCTLIGVKSLIKWGEDSEARRGAA